MFPPDFRVACQSFSIRLFVELRLPFFRLNDGEWHHASVKWMVGEVWLNLDYGQHEITQQTNIGIQV